MRGTVPAALLAFATAACSREVALPTSDGEVADLGLRSDSFPAGGQVPRRHSCDGSDVSPPLTWDPPPSGTGTLALTVTDPDAPGGTAVHWTVWNMDAGWRGLSEGVALDEAMPPPLQGPTYTGEPGWHGPCPPPEDPPHTYELRLWAVDGALDPQEVDDETELDALYRALDGRILGSGLLTGTYER